MARGAWALLLVLSVVQAALGMYLPRDTYLSRDISR
jgi:hypothetical protein